MLKSVSSAVRIWRQLSVIVVAAVIATWQVPENYQLKILALNMSVILEH